MKNALLDGAYINQSIGPFIWICSSKLSMKCMLAKKGLAWVEAKSPKAWFERFNRAMVQFEYK